MIIFRPGGGIGDQIISLPILDFLIKTFPSEPITAILAGEPYKHILGTRNVTVTPNPYPGNCDLFVECHEIVYIRVTEDFLNKYPQFKPTIETYQERMKILMGLENSFPQSGNHVGNLAEKMGKTRVTFPQWLLGLSETYPVIRTQKNNLTTLYGLPDRFVTINDGWNDSGNDFRATKAWHPDCWKLFIQKCQNKGIPTVQLGSTNNGESYDVDFQFRGKLSFDKSLEILNKSTVHVDIEGGLVHAKAAMGGRSVVLFGPTNLKFFGYPQNKNLIHGACQNCWHLTNTWGRDCLARNHTCMNHSPGEVFEAMLELYNP